jgi:phosphoribosylformylglycinamidine cyclo-ligase
VILGLASSGLHSNGFSLVRKVLVQGREAELTLQRADLGGATLGELLLTPTRLYVKSVLSTIAAVPVKGMGHITGGGITENLDRVLPKNCDARVVRGSWKVPQVFDLVQDAAGIDDESMYRTFNMGVGFALVVDATRAPEAAAKLRECGETVSEIGEIVAGTGAVIYG